MTTILHDDDPNEAPITELFAWLSIDGDGNEGIVAAGLPGLGWTQLITSKERIANKMRKPAMEAGNMSGKKVVLVRFKRVDE